MSTSDLPADGTATGASRAGVYLAILQLVFTLGLATFARMAAVAGGLQNLPEYAPLLHWAPVACWSVAGAGLLVIAASRAQASVARMRTV